MKTHSYLKSILTLILLTATLSFAKGGAVVVKGVAYDVLNEDAQTAQVVPLPNGAKYTNVLTIAADVTMNSVTYTVKKIGDGALRDAPKLTNVIIPEGLEIIGNSSFAGCTGITSLQLPTTINSIEDWAFYGCSSMGSINIPAGITAITAHTFQNSGLTSIELPTSVKTLQGCAFQDASKLASINLEKIRTIEAYALYGTALSSVKLTDVLNIGGEAFRNCKQLKSFILRQENATGAFTIEGWTFTDNTQLTNVELPDGLVAISGGMFSGCSALQSLSIPYSVQKIENWSLEKTGIKEIAISWPNPATVVVEDWAFGVDTGKINFIWRVPTHLASTYGSAWLGYPVVSGYAVKSPNKKMQIIVNVNNGTEYQIWYEEKQLIAPSSIAMHLNNGTVIGKGNVKSTQTRFVDEELPVLIGKNKTLHDTYNELTILFNENYNLVLRAYNEGVAYRWVTALTGEIIVDNEDFIFNFADNPTVYFPEAENLEHWEKRYTTGTTSSFNANRYAVTPILFSWSDKPHKIVIAESDLYDYPGLYIQATGSKSMKGMWAKYPKTVHQPDNIYSNHVPLTRYDYIAKVAGNRTFPWRVFAISEDDKDLLNNELVYLLAEPQRLTETNWIVSGKTTWEWWHKAMLTPDGQADPANGIPPNSNANLNLNLYKYYVDFAAENNLQYLTLDAGHSLGNTELRLLCNYGNAKNVKILLWTWASQPLEESGYLNRQKNNGIAGLKIDFFQRNDQIAMTWGHRLAQELADRKMVAIFHGCPVPTGLNRTFPNILNYEAVLGNEENFWRKGSDPDYHVQYPFIRSIAGPADYTPGSMRNKNKTQFSPVDQTNVVPSSQGTRAHELAMYVVFDHWLAFLCDAPTEYRKYPDILDFLAHVPTVWDKTLPLNSKLGQYITIAKQSGTDWFVGGMSSWTASNVEVDFSFLKPGKIYTAQILKDGNNANNYPTRYTAETIDVTNQTKITFNMSNGGGFVIRLIEQNPTSIENTEIKTSTTWNIQQDELQIRSNKNIRSVAAYTLTGQLLLNREFSGDSHSQNLNLSGWNKGVYIIKIKTESAIDSFKFIY